jgi:hypothetical protein
MTITYQEIIDCGAWSRFCELHGVSEWAVSEGGGNCQICLTMDQAYHLDIVKMNGWKGARPFDEVYPCKTA